MSDAPISKMNDKQLRKEVQSLRDELAIMRRKYEDIIYNLDTNNFSSRFVKEQNNMKTAIKVTAEGIKTKVSKEDLDAFQESTFEQTAEQISATVTRNFVTNLLDGEYVTNATFESQFNIYADGIYATVEKTYETKDEAGEKYDDLYQSISSVSIEADGITSRVGRLENGEYGDFTLFEQTADGFYLTGDVHISGDTIAGGIITGASFQNSDETTKLYLGAESGSNVGDLKLVRISGDGTETPTFAVYDNLSSIDLMIKGQSIIYSSGYNSYPLGTWDFSKCEDVIGLDDFVTGGGTGSVVARFG